jgi:hypothetical protein
MAWFKSYPIANLSGCFMGWPLNVHFGGFVLCDAQYAHEFELPDGYEGYCRALEFNLG